MWARRVQTLVFVAVGAAAGYFLAAARSAPTASAPSSTGDEPAACCRENLRGQLLLRSVQPTSGEADQPTSAVQPKDD